MHETPVAFQPSKLAKKAPPVAPVAIVGARGYSGQELARLLLAHPQAELAGVYGSGSEASSGWKLSEVLAGARAAAVPSRPVAGIADDIRADGLHTVFLATPPEVSLELAPRILAAGSRVIDLSAAYRQIEDVSAGVDYGLVPWSGPLKPGVRLIANPGCYVTSVLLSLIPLLKDGLLEPGSLVIDAKSGATGAGRKASESLALSEVADECRPYKVGSHAHVPEIARYLKAFAGCELEPWFTPHLLPIRRGILTSIYGRLRSEVTALEVGASFLSAYGDYPLIEWGALGPEGSPLLSLKRVVGTPRTQLAYAVHGDRLSLFASLDNLLKGAASQAVENFNRLLDLPVETGLLIERT